MYTCVCVYAHIHALGVPWRTNIVLYTTLNLSKSSVVPSRICIHIYVCVYIYIYFHALGVPRRIFIVLCTTLNFPKSSVLPSRTRSTRSNTVVWGSPGDGEGCHSQVLESLFFWSCACTLAVIYPISARSVNHSGNFRTCMWQPSPLPGYPKQLCLNRLWALYHVEFWKI